MESAFHKPVGGKCHLQQKGSAFDDGCPLPKPIPILPVLKKRKKSGETSHFVMTTYVSQFPPTFIPKDKSSAFFERNKFLNRNIGFCGSVPTNYEHPPIETDLMEKENEISPFDIPVIKTNEPTLSTKLSSIRIHLCVFPIATENPLEKVATASSQGAQGKREGKAYSYRNVYKSILRNLQRYMRKNSKELFEFMKKYTYAIQDVEHAFFKVNYYNDLERQKGNPKKAQSVVKKITEKRSIYTILLREALSAMLRNLNEGKLGKITPNNQEIYREVCEKYYKLACSLTSEAAQLTSLSL